MCVGGWVWDHKVLLPPGPSQFCSGLGCEERDAEVVGPAWHLCEQLGAHPRMGFGVLLPVRSILWEAVTGILSHGKTESTRTQDTGLVGSEHA